MGEQAKRASQPPDSGHWTLDLDGKERVSQIVSLTGFSFVGGPAMNDSEAATEYLSELNVPFRSLSVSIFKPSKRGALGRGLIRFNQGCRLRSLRSTVLLSVRYGGMAAESVRTRAADRSFRCDGSPAVEEVDVANSGTRRSKTRPRHLLFPPNKGNIERPPTSMFLKPPKHAARASGRRATVDVPEDARHYGIFCCRNQPPRPE